MKTVIQKPMVGAAARIGAALFTLWGILHIWVGYEGIHRYLSNGTPGLIELSAGSVGGPVIWLMAIIVTPFGMPSMRNK
jgi:hypothetical protein